MSLYDGLDMDEKPGSTNSSKADIVGWGSSLKLLETQKQIQEKKLQLQNLTKQRKQPAAASLAPVIDLKGKKDDIGGNLRFNQITGKMEHISRSSSNSMMSNTPSFILNDAPVAFLGIEDEYDPFKPNDYEIYVKKMRKINKRQNRDSDREEEDDYLSDREKRRSRRERDRESRRRDDDDRKRRGRDEDDDDFDRRRRKRDADEEERNKDLNAGGKVAIGPPPSLMELDIKPTEDFQGPQLNKADAPGTNFGLGGSVASKIMARMGYKEGQGLGKQEQGMSIALQVERMTKKIGKIIHEKDLHKSQDPNVPRAEISNANLLKNPSKVIILRNMVGPGDVDDCLEGEVSEECTKYGKVVKCVIFEIPEREEEEAVRIFVEFDRLEASIKAVVDLNGRFFGGRVVKGNFYNYDKFKKFDLAEDIE